MNAYESKSVKVITDTRKRIDDTRGEIKQYDQEIVELDKIVESLLLSKSSINDANVVLAIERSIEETQAKRNAKYIRKLDAEHHLKRNNETLRTLQLHICPHLETVYEFTDYHKNEEIHRCLLCDDVI